ncbi:MAG: SWIM zinc finger family protein [Sedimentisphaerales bacterium]|nr:SWIM zinc finger family protein [Sedimentisphaerales bacterium]
MMSWYYGWRPYVPVAVRRARALKKMEKLRKKGLDIQPVEIEGRKIARTFWGKAWCDHLESFSDYENRLPRGRTYVRNGSVCHLNIAKGEIDAMVSGSELYKVKVAIKTLARKKWNKVKERCAGQIGSLIELLQGRLCENVMAIVTNRNQGLFPSPREISLRCSCPDWAVMCKHVAAVLYGVAARLDERPELLFLLRGVDHEELISAEVDVATAVQGAKGGRRRIADDALADVFGIEMSEDAIPVKSKSSRRRKKTAPRETARSAVKRKTRTRKSTPRATKKSVPRKAGATSASRTGQGARPVTGKAVAGLRAKFGMSQSKFARLLGVSAPSIGNWEKKSGTLNLQPRTRYAWNKVKRLTKKQSWSKVNHS